MATTFGEWLAVRSRSGRRKSLSVHTLRQKSTALNTVSGRCSELFGTRNLEDVATALVDRDRVEALFDSLMLTHAAGTVRNHYFCLRDFERYARAQGWVSSFALHDDDCPPSDPQAHVDPFTPDELAAITYGSRMKGQRWHLFVMTLIHTGRRIGEVLDLTYADVKLDADVPHLVISKPKGQTHAQYAPLNSVLQVLYEDVEALRDETQGGQYRTTKDVQTYLFPWTYTNARARWSKMLEALGIEYRNPHQLRHTRATALIAKGAPLVGVARLLGHANVSTTDRYYNHVTALSYAELLD